MPRTKVQPKNSVSFKDGNASIAQDNVFVSPRIESFSEKTGYDVLPSSVRQRLAPRQHTA